MPLYDDQVTQAVEITDDEVRDTQVVQVVEFRLIEEQVIRTDQVIQVQEFGQPEIRDTQVIQIIEWRPITVAPAVGESQLIIWW